MFQIFSMCVFFMDVHMCLTCVCVSRKRIDLRTMLTILFLWWCFVNVRLESMHINVIRDQTLPDEHLYGRCGYLSALMYVQHYLGWEKVDKEIIVKVLASFIYFVSDDQLYDHYVLLSMLVEI